MKLITDSNLELVIQKFYERVIEEFSVADSAHRLETGRNLTIGEVSKTFDGTQDLFWSLTDIGIGSPSNLTTSNKSNVVNAINELNANKASIAYVDNAVENVSIDDAVTAVELVGNVDDIEIDFVTQSELEEALSNLDDIDIDGMVTAVDVGNVNIGQGGGSGGVDDSVIGQLSSLQTANKTNLVGAINELFQNANNGKELIATAIGSPLSSSDTFSAMSTKINTLTTNFKSALLNKGVAISGTDTFQSLITKIESIDGGSSNVGTKVATGEVAVSAVNKTFTLTELDPNTGVETTSETISLPCYAMTVDFEPSMFNAEIVFDMEGDYSVTCTYRYDNLSNSNAKVVMAGFGFTLVTPLLKEGNTIYLPDVFSIESGEGTSTPKYPMLRSSYAAMGIGEVGEDPALLESLKSVLQSEGVSVSSSDTIATLISKVDSEFDRQVVPQGTATVSDVISGKTFMNSTGQLLTGTASKGLATATGTVNVSSTLYTSKSFSINVGFTPTRLIAIIPKVWYNSGSIEHQNVVVTNGTTTTLNAGANQNGTITISSMSSSSFNIQMSSLQIPSGNITWIAFG